MLMLQNLVIAVIRSRCIWVLFPRVRTTGPRTRREQDRLQRADVEKQSEYRLFDPVKDALWFFCLIQMKAPASDECKLFQQYPEQELGRFYKFVGFSDPNSFNDSY